MPSGKKRKRHKVATHKRKKRRRANRHKKKQLSQLLFHFNTFIDIEICKRISAGKQNPALNIV